ncbi:MAG: zf-HC2 domain-containing protein [Propionibacteriales bacterium]|nr:zf-HC2 domain-containing protein [Propionibacteriales bacterium]
MSTEHDRLRDLLGPYVLGGLDAADRARIDTHLATCPSCRDELAAYAGLPALLRLADGPASSAAQDPDDDALSRTLDTVRHDRRRHRHLAVLGSAAAAVVVLGLGATTTVLVAQKTDNPQSSPTGISLVAASGIDSRGQTSLTAKPWGTSVDLDLSGLPSGQRFVVWVVSTDGARQQAATWASTPDGLAHVTGASALNRADVTAVRVTTTQGMLLLSADI